MKKKLISIALVLIMALSLFGVTALAVNASPTSSTVLVNGTKVAFDAYNINGNNYFKLRDLAYTLNGTVKQFEVGYDSATRAITLTSGKSYTTDGSEMIGKGAGNKDASPTTSKIYMDGKEVQFTAYNIGGNNYFKLRDIGAAFDFGVDWDGAAQTISIDTSKIYTPETATPTPTPQPSGETDKKLVGFWVRDSSDYRYYLSFKDDGSYSYIQITGSITTTVTGRYTASNGRVYLTNLVDDMGRNLKNQSMGYSFGTDSDGEFISIATVWFALVGTDEEPQEMSPTQFWRSQ